MARAEARAAILTATVVALLGAMVAAAGSGTLPFVPAEVAGALFGRSGDPVADQVIRNIRLPRVLAAVLVGMHMALSGTLLQGVLRNPLAAPNVIGVNAGAGLAAVAVMVLAPGAFAWVPPAAFLGALAAAALVVALGSGLGGFHAASVQIVLAGVAVSAFFGAATSALMIAYSDDLVITYAWLLGGLSGRGWSYLSLLWPYTLVGTLLALALAPKLNLFALGEEVGRSLGLAAGRVRALAILVAALLAGSAVAVAGTVGFVGLIAPHAARLLVRDDYRVLMPLAGLLGALLMLLADTAARTLFQPVELPVGILTAAVGAPFFLLLLRGAR